MILPDVDGISRSDIDNLQLEIKKTQSNINTIDGTISSQRGVIITNEITVNEKKELLRDAKNKIGDSWDSLKFIDIAEQNLSYAEKTLKESKDKLITLLNEKSDHIKNLKLLREKLDSERIKLYIENRYDYSHLTKLVGVQLSKNCVTMIIHDITNNCPNPKDLMSLDSSNVKFSGSFDTDGFREQSKYSKSWRAYDTDDTIRIIVDPPLGMNDKIKMVTIESSLNVYFTPSDFKLDNNIRTWHDGIYLDKCNNAVISSDNWKTTLPMVIMELREGCVNELVKTKSEVMPFTELDISQSASWQAKEKLEADKLRCKTLCFEY
jgi:hypothetical protein